MEQNILNKLLLIVTLLPTFLFCQEVNMHIRGSIRTQMDSTQLIDLFLTLLNDQEALVRIDAANSLGYLGNLKAVFYLIQKLNDEDYNVRNTVAQALGELKDTSATLPLLKVFNYCDKEIVIEALGNLKDGRAVDSILNVIKVEDTRNYTATDNRAYYAAVWALRKIGRPSIEPLQNILLDENSRKKGDEFQGNLRTRAAYILAGIDDKKVADILIPYVQKKI